MCKPSVSNMLSITNHYSEASSEGDHFSSASTSDSETEILLNRINISGSSEETSELLANVDSEPPAPSPESQLDTIDEKLKRVSKFLHEIQTLSPVCEEASEELKERQIFVRRILQVGAELQDAKDVVTSLCAPPRLTPRQFDLLVSSSGQDNVFELDPSLDPSVRFFGVDWQLVFGKCFSLSLNIGIFRAQVLNAGAMLDLVLVHSILKDLARIEVDVSSHGEAVMNGRLSKSQQRLIKQEQSRLTSLAVPATKVSKSRSFREGGSFRSTRGGQQRQISKYKKNKTCDLNRLTESASTQEHLSSYANNNDRKISSGSTNSERKISSSSEKATSDVSHEWDEVLAPKRKTSFIQNVSSLFKNIR